MTNKPIQSIQYPGLPDTYTFVQIGTESGQAADDKAVGDMIDELKNDFDANIDVVTRKMTLVKSPNLLDPDAVTENTLINGANGNAGTNNSYYSTDYINVEGVTTIYLYNATPSASQMRTGAFYNENKIFISGFTSGVTSASVPANAKYARVSVSNTDSPSTKMLVADRPTMMVFYAYYDPHFIAGDDFIVDLDIDNTTFGNIYLDYEYVNRLNPEECQTGKFINGTTGAISDNATYFVTNYMPINKNETIYIYRDDTLANKNLRTIAAYDRNKNLLSGYGTNTESSSYTQTGDVAFIRATIYYNASDPANTPPHTIAVASSYPIYTSRYGNTPSIKGEYIRKCVQIFVTDTESTVISKLVDAYYQNNCDVYFECGTYNFGDGLANIKTTYNLLENEIPIGNGCRYFFNGATLNAVIDVSENPDFYCNLFGTQRSPSDFELHDGILKATDVRYVVHDEASGKTRSYKHLYDNIEMEYTTVNRTEAIRKCIGGGTGKYGVVEIVGCKFITDGTDACVSFHGNSTDVAGAKFLLNVRGSWFYNNIRAGELSANQTAKLFYTGNSSASQYQTYERWEVTAFLNEVRG